MIYYKILAFVGVLMTALSQISLKIGAKKKIRHSLIRSLFNIWTISGYAILVSVTLINLFAYRILPLKVMILLLPMNYIFVVVFSRVILKEKINRIRIFGLSVIVCGILIYNF